MSLILYKKISLYYIIFFNLVLFETEKEATHIAKDFYKLNKQLEQSLNQISASCVCCLQTYRDSMNTLFNTLNDCLIQEESLIEKANDLSKQMEPVYQLQNKILSIKTIIGSLESQI